MRLSPLFALSGAATVLAACADYPAAYYGPPPPGPRAHIRWCLSHHPAYDPRTNLFPDAAGAPLACVAPWERRPAPPPGYGPPPPVYGPPPPLMP